MDFDKSVFHVLKVEGFSSESFDEAVDKAIQGAWKNHHSEFLKFVSFKASDFQGTIVQDSNSKPKLKYSVTVEISAIHKDHDLI